MSNYPISRFFIMSNRYYWHSRLAEGKFRSIVCCFAEDKTAAITANETDLDRKSVNNIFLRIRRRILEAPLKNRPLLRVKEFKTKRNYFVAESESECKKYSKQYKSRVLVALFENGLIRADIIYAESEETFDEIQNAMLIEKDVKDSELFEILTDPLRIKHWHASAYNQALILNYSGNLLLYFFQRIKKFRGTSWEKFILHLRETEWRFNKFMISIKSGKVLTNEELNYLVLKDTYYEILKILRKNPL